MDWMHVTAVAASIAVLLAGAAVFLVTTSALCLAVASMWMSPSRAERALRVVAELRGLVAALRGKPQDEAA